MGASIQVWVRVTVGFTISESAAGSVPPREDFSCVAQTQTVGGNIIGVGGWIDGWMNG